MSREMKFGILVACALFALVIPAYAAVDDMILSTNSIVSGRTIGEWSGAWWQWAWSIPDGVHPLFDTTGSG